MFAFMRRLFSLVLAALLLSQTAFAISYQDVPEDFGYAPALTYVADRNYMRGYADGSFRSDAAVTLKQMSVVLGRVFALSAETDPVRWLVNKTYIRPGVVPDDILNGVVSLDTAMGILGRAFGVLPTQGESVMFPAYSDQDAAIYMRNAGLMLGVFDIYIDDVLSHECLTRSDLAYLIYRMDKYAAAHPEISGYGWDYIDVTCVGPYEYLIHDAWDDVLILPWPVVKHFHDAGYRIVCGESAVSRFDLRGLSVVGVFSPVDKSIFVQQIDGVIHAMGHYVSSFMVGLTEAKAAFPLERAAAVEYISPNAGRSVDEFFAECFNYYIRAKNANNYASMTMMRERMPEIWAFISNMDVLNWCAAAKYVPAEVVGTGVFPMTVEVYSVHCREF